MSVPLCARLGSGQFSVRVDGLSDNNHSEPGSVEVVYVGAARRRNVSRSEWAGRKRGRVHARTLNRILRSGGQPGAALYLTAVAKCGSKLLSLAGCENRERRSDVDGWIVISTGRYNPAGQKE